MKGTISQIIGPVVDVAFPEGAELPAIYDALELEHNKKRLVLEVQSHLGANAVRTIAMDATDGLARGVEVASTGAPISVPVGKATLGRIFNVVGDVIDGGKPVGKTARDPIHRAAPSYTAQSTQMASLIFSIRMKTLLIYFEPS